ncbi:MAG: hypothetical protein K8L99_18270 [Anaerolineae bacterium]|nr:hypothetical protein [Anaerolineae bacterium]
MKRWLPIGICCLPGFAAVLVAAGIITVKGMQSMDINTLFLLVMGLACPIGMGLMMWLMNKNMSHQPEQSSSDKQKRISAADRLVALHEERRALESEIAELSHEVELDGQRPLPLSGSPYLPEDTSFSDVR